MFLIVSINLIVHNNLKCVSPTYRIIIYNPKYFNSNNGSINYVTKYISLALVYRRRPE